MWTSKRWIVVLAAVSMVTVGLSGTVGGQGDAVEPVDETGCSTAGVTLATPCSAWMTTSLEDRKASDIALGPLGGTVYAVGNTAPGEAVQGIVVAMDAATGTPLWRETLEVEDAEVTAWQDIEASPSGMVLYLKGLTSASGTFGDRDVVVSAISAVDGTELWRTIFASDHGEADHARALSLSPAGQRVAIAGQTGGDALRTAEADGLVAIFDAVTGNLITSTTYATPGTLDMFNDLAWTDDGERLLATGVSDGELPVAAFEAASGDLAWEATYTTPDALYHRGTHVELSPDGGTVYAAGYGGGPSVADFDAVVLAVSTDDGEIDWTTRMESPDGDLVLSKIGPSLAVGPDGDQVYITGTENFRTGVESVVVAALDAQDGTETWRLDHSGTGPFRGLGLTVSPDGSTLYATGSRSAWTVLAVDADDGALESETVERPSVDAGPRMPVVSPLGDRLYVGGSIGSADEDVDRRIFAVAGYSTGALVDGSALS